MFKKTNLLMCTLLTILFLLSISFVTYANSSIGTLNFDEQEFIMSMYNDPVLSSEDKEEMEQLLQMTEWLNANKNIDNETKEFESIEHEYNMIVDYIKSILSDHASNGYICLGVDGIDESNIRLSIASQDGKLLGITNDVKTSLISIQNSFDNMGYDLDTIRVSNNTIAFESIDGQYSLVYLLNDDIKTANETTANSSLVKFKDNWYHKVS